MADQAQNKNPREQRLASKEPQPAPPAEAELVEQPELQPLDAEPQATQPVSVENAGETPAPSELGKITEGDIASLQQPVLPPAPPVPKSNVRKRIESVLSEDLSELYATMDPPTKAAFKAQGVVVASRVEEMIRTAKIRAQDIVDLIRSWLRMIPGINKFFLEQETKIKADKIADLAMNKHKYQ